MNTITFCRGLPACTLDQLRHATLPVDPPPLACCASAGQPRTNSRDTNTQYLIMMNSLLGLQMDILPPAVVKFARAIFTGLPAMLL
jgi:hypothetical protein